jgi:hypothetical protein
MKKVLKLFAAVFLIGMAACVFAAIFRQETYPSEMKKTLKNEALAAYYTAEGKIPEAFTHDPIDSFDYVGNIQAKHLTYIPEIDQVQISVRYGTVAFENIADKYELTEIPALGCKDITFRLRAMKLTDTAFTNEDKNIDEGDILEEKYIDPSAVKSLVEGRHEYHRFVFDGVDLDSYNCLYLEMYYAEKEKAFTNIIIYHSDAAEHSKESVKLTPEDCAKPAE